MPPYGANTSPTARHLDHHFGNARHCAADLIPLRRGKSPPMSRRTPPIAHHVQQWFLTTKVDRTLTHDPPPSCAGWHRRVGGRDSLELRTRATASSDLP